MVNFKEYLDFILPDIKRVKGNSSTTKSTCLTSPRKDELRLSVWKEFITSAHDFVEGVPDFDLKDNPLQVFQLPSDVQTVSCEDQVTNICNLYIGYSMSTFFRALNQVKPEEQDCVYIFSPKDNSVLLKPDICIYQTSLGKPKKLVAAIEVKTPWALDIPEGNIVAKFESEKKLALERGDREPATTQRNDTKVHRVISQLWGYLSVNHLKYGVITTYSQTYFFRRPESTSQICQLEVSPGISVQGNLIAVFKAWYYFLNTLKQDFLYTSPYSPPKLLHKQVKTKKNKYEPIDIDLCQVYFNEPFAFGSSCSVTTGRVTLSSNELSNLDGNNFILKVFDGSKDSCAKSLFEREIFAYQTLEAIQGDTIPHFHCGLIASGFVFVIVLEKIAATKDCLSNVASDKVRLAYSKLHSLGVIHNDVAKRNVLDTSDSVRIVDFGRSLFCPLIKKSTLPVSWFLSVEEYQQAQQMDLDQVQLLTEAE
jgi:serine/threonine protein kinase